jgi:hypothetical protein
LIESRHRRQDENGLFIFNWCPRCGQVVHIVVDDWRRRLGCVRFRLSEGQRWRGQWVRRSLSCPSASANRGRIAAGEEEYDKANAQNARKDNRDGI